MEPPKNSPHRKRKKEKKSVVVAERNWLELPAEVTSAILQKLLAIDILLGAQKVCTAWRKICKDPLMWRSIDFENLGDTMDMPYDLEKMAMHAIDRSCGNLLDINIQYFGTDELLEYMADRSTQLTCLRLASGYGFSDEGITAAVAKLPLLTDIEFTICQFSEDALKTIGRCCPLLRSFKLNNLFRRPLDEYCNEEALAIATSMPDLRHLQLIGNTLTNDALQAILDGCPHLISLDLRCCFNINLDGNLGKRCAKQIKELRRPHDSTKGYGWQTDANATHKYDDGPGPYDRRIQLQPYRNYYGPSDDDEYSSDGDEYSSDGDEYSESSGGSDFSDCSDEDYD